LPRCGSISQVDEEGGAKMSDSHLEEPSRHVEEPPEDPAKRTGADDPFDPVDPDDPMGITLPRDPYVPVDPDPDITINGGVPAPPSVPPVRPSEPPGRTNLRTAIQRVADRAVKINGPESSQRIARTARTVQPGRNELGEHWTATVGILVANDRARVGAAEEPDFDRITKLADTLDKHQDFGEALSAWCSARDAVPPDEAALAGILDKATDALNRLKNSLEGQGFDPDNVTGSTDIQAETIRLFAEASLKILSDEAAMIMAGQPVPRAAPSEGASARLAMGTGNSNFQDRIGNANSWNASGTLLGNAIGSNALLAVVTRTVGRIDLTRANQELASLDASLKARSTAADPSDPAVQTAVYDDYLAVIDAHAEQLHKLRAAAAEKGPSPTKAWNPAKIREATDMVVTMLRTVKQSLGADPLVQDPAFATRTREMVSQIDVLAGPTSLETDSQALGSDLRKVWKTAKTQEMSALTKAGVDTKKLSAMFDAGLGPALDSWATELAKFPKQNRATMKDLATQSATLLSSYRAAAVAVAGKSRSSNLVHALDMVALAMVRQLGSYDARGGLF
jgi:hypothetical protein